MLFLYLKFKGCGFWQDFLVLALLRFWAEWFFFGGTMLSSALEDT